MTTLVLPPLKWTSSANFSGRQGAKVRLIVAHDCEGSYAGSINWFSQSRSKVSAHYVLREDGKEATQMVRTGNSAWAVCSFNRVSESIEMGGYEAKGFDAPEWDAAAAIVAYRLKANGLPCRWAEKGIGEGYCRHFDLGEAGGGHRDPSTDQTTWEAFMTRVEAAYAQEMPDSWPIAGQVRPPDAPPGFTPSSDQRHDLVVGSMEWIQMELNAHHATSAPIHIDGLDGVETERAVAAFQASRGIHIDGIPGPQTIAALEAA